ncbi:MAG: hypothetical protein KAT77_06330 [Nanoarchaeota archaeon]|nr:hypothetical protein [Nanoarchaeota archaeon]
MQKIELVRGLLDRKKLAVMDILFNAHEEMYLGEISKKSKVPVATCFRIIGELVKLDLVKVVQIKRLKLYLVEKNEKTLFWGNILKKGRQVLDDFISMVKDMPGLQEVMLHGEEMKDRANLLVIGENLDESVLKRAMSDIRDKYQFTITYLPLTLLQYKQMSVMGMYGEKKKVIWARK